MWESCVQVLAAAVLLMPFAHARRPFAALAPFSCSQLSIPFSWLRSHLTRRVSTTISAA